MTSPSRLSLSDLLNLFPTNEIAKALVRAGLPGGGSKIERLERLRAATKLAGVSAPQVLDLFGSEAIRRVAVELGVRKRHKSEMIAGLEALLTEPPAFPATRGPPTLNRLRQLIRGLSGSWRTIRSEADAEWFVASAIADYFENVSTQVIVPGRLGHRIDIDIGHGRLGVEIKLATTIINSSSEAYRLLGQAFYYDRRRYAGRLLVVIVGSGQYSEHGVILELVDLLTAIGIAVEYVSVFP